MPTSTIAKRRLRRQLARAFGVLATAIMCIAAVLVVPEVRQFLSLDRGESAHPAGPILPSSLAPPPPQQQQPSATEALSASPLTDQPAGGGRTIGTSIAEPAASQEQPVAPPPPAVATARATATIPTPPPTPIPTPDAEHPLRGTFVDLRYDGRVEAKAFRAAERLEALGATVEVNQDIVEPAVRFNHVLYGTCNKDIAASVRQSLRDITKLSLKESIEDCPRQLLIFILS